ncbi:HNH endonuclease signature motif containing protein [Lactobacillus sp. ESL0677]|uniref:HNH endonuclease n=1 Tax=Lactobacillus sp. ESL0677 TaxID=2983208 RepID=UPI0023F658C6|nr:HNH endonuclease signature motif containing protein [Lactobacillus sp. ESL0677]WEV36226.1 HNH endonuclease signature motif containing protein [Lactobacillus sp. ESL0677]
MQLKRCRYATCNNLIPKSGIPYCKLHAYLYHPYKFKCKHRAGYYRQYNRLKRDPIANQFYHSKEWRQLSDRLRKQSFYTCQVCGRTKDGSSMLVVDHIIPLKVQPSLRLTRSNLWVLCKECHYWKTKLEQKIYSDSIVANLDISKRWSIDKIKQYILSNEVKKLNRGAPRCK